MTSPSTRHPRYLFVMGCPRSGTTALWRVLTGHHSVVLGVERYGVRFMRPEFLDPGLFERDRFFRIVRGDTFYDELGSLSDYYEQARGRFDDAVYRGDKIPFLYRHLPRLVEVFGRDVRVIFIFRNIFDIADSYTRRAGQLDDPKAKQNWAVRTAVGDWADAISAGLAYRGDPNFLFLQYEEFFQNGRGMETVFRFLDLDVTPPAEDAYRAAVQRSAAIEAQRTRALGYRDVDHITRHAPFEAYRQLLAQCQIVMP